MARGMRVPPKGELWVHIDRLDREDGRVWAIQYRVSGKPQYAVAQGVVIQAASSTRFYGPTGRQPRAVICVPEPVSVRITNGIAVIAKGD